MKGMHPRLALDSDPPSADRDETPQADGVLPFVACVARKCEQAHISLAILGNKRVPHLGVSQKCGNGSESRYVRGGLG